MYIKTIEYTDYSGNKRKEDFYFNLSKAEIMEMELSKEGGFDQWITRIANAQNTPELVKLFKSLILMSYGERSLDGKAFYKKDPQTGRPLCEAATEFINKVIPEDAAEAIDKAKADGSLDEVTSKIYPLSK